MDGDMIVRSIFLLFSLLLGATIHEYAHGQVADWLGDDTPRRQGRLTINPIPHMDLFGSVILPLIFVLMPTGFFFAYAKPVQINPLNFRNPRRGMLLTSLAGPGINLLVVAAVAIVMHIAAQFFSPGDGVLVQLLMRLLLTLIMINFILAFFNMIPVPPLDGSRLLMNVLPLPLARSYARLGIWGLVLIILLINTRPFQFVFSLAIELILWVLGLLPIIQEFKIAL